MGGCLDEREFRFADEFRAVRVEEELGFADEVGPDDGFDFSRDKGDAMVLGMEVGEDGGVGG